MKRYFTAIYLILTIHEKHTVRQVLRINYGSS